MPENPNPAEWRVASFPTPKHVVEHLDRTVIGQSRAKRTLAIAVSNHYKRILDASDRSSADPVVSDPVLREVRIEKSNVLLIGPSGSGKTHLARSLADFLNVPFANADATTLTEAGYLGEDVEGVLHRLLIASGMDVGAAQCGVVYIDEVDKLRAGHALGSKDMKLGVQHALLKMLEGSVVNVPPSGGHRQAGETCIAVDTTNILFICGGAFGGLEEIVARRTGRDAFGFGLPVRVVEINGDKLVTHVLPEDLERYGLIPELLGRLPVIATLDDLGIEDLVRILREPRNSLIGQYRKLLAYHHAELEFTDGAIREIARIAHLRGLGARGLRAVVEAVLEPVMFEPEPWASYVVTEETVRGGSIGKLDFLDLLEATLRPVSPVAPLRHRLRRRSVGA